MSCRRDRVRDQVGQQARNALPVIDSWQTQLTQLRQSNVRIGDAERDQAAAGLAEHYAGGRLDREEYDERLGAVFAAKTWGDLAPLFRDLPGPGPAARTKPVPPPPPPPARRFGPPLLPVLLVLLGVAFMADAFFVLWIGLSVLLWMRVATHRRAHANGSWRGTRGSWS